MTELELSLQAESKEMEATMAFNRGDYKEARKLWHEAGTLLELAAASSAKEGRRVWACVQLSSAAALYHFGLHFEFVFLRLRGLVSDMNMGMDGDASRHVALSRIDEMVDAQKIMKECVAVYNELQEGVEESKFTRDFSSLTVTERRWVKEMADNPDGYCEVFESSALR